MVHDDGRTRSCVGPIWMLLVCLATALIPAVGAAAPVEPEWRDRSAAADSDGDGIADDFDPDDNNNGVADDQEGAAPGPDILAPGKDTDGDGITNVLDPDDNNNAVTDENDPSSFPPTNGGGPAEPNPGAPSTSPPRPGGRTDTPARDDDGRNEVLIQALPDTGSGPGGSRAPIVLIAATLLMLTGAAGAYARANQTPAQAAKHIMD